jgi:hypothetical protein
MKFLGKERRKENVKKFFLALSMAALLSACVHGGAAPPQDRCPNGQYWSAASEACQEYPKSMDRTPVDGPPKMAKK